MFKFLKEWKEIGIKNKELKEELAVLNKTSEVYKETNNINKEIIENIENTKEKIEGKQ